MPPISLSRGVVLAVPHLLLAAAIHAQPPAHPPARPIPGITAVDAFPRACVDCHVRRPDAGLDVRLSTLMKGWSEGAGQALLAKAHLAGGEVTGRHPEAAAALASIPSGCLSCHGQSRDGAPPFARLMHAIHLTGGGENHFLTLFQGECTHCHKLDAATASWTLPSAPEP